ncbi:MAG: hypothetical protein BWX98_02498 [Candidatus Aminicenantes bacterium ADurb.Bin147]|nr:MAG: hypothetical protein BWX98_02498 [Candidatus Aminicenantes bacterium ADurb.Bin147]
MAGSEIFLMITALPEMDRATSLEVIFALLKASLIVAETAAESMIDPSTITS